MPNVEDLATPSGENGDDSELAYIIIFAVIFWLLSIDSFIKWYTVDFQFALSLVNCRNRAQHPPKGDWKIDPFLSMANPPPSLRQQEHIIDLPHLPLDSSILIFPHILEWICPARHPDAVCPAAAAAAAVVAAASSSSLTCSIQPNIIDHWQGGG